MGALNLDALKAVLSSLTGQPVEEMTQHFNYQVLNEIAAALPDALGGSFNPASPGAIGGTTPGSGAFTTLDASSISLLDAGVTRGTVYIGLGADDRVIVDSGANGNGVVLKTNAGDVLEAGYAGDVTIRSAAKLGFGSIGLSSPDTLLQRDSAGVLAQRNGANAQEQRWYGTYVDSANGRWGSISVDSSGVVTLHAKGNGTGSSGNTLRLDIDGTTYYPHDTGGTLAWTTTP